MWSDTSWLVRPRGKARSQLEQNVLPSLLYLAWLRALETDNFLCCEGCHVWCHRHWTFSSPDPDNLCSLRFCMCWLSLCFCTFHYVYAFLSWSPLLGLVFQFFEVVWSLACSMGDFTFTLYMLIKFHVDLVWSYDIFLGWNPWTSLWKSVELRANMDGSLLSHRPPQDHARQNCRQWWCNLRLFGRQFLRARAEEISLTAGPLRNLNSVKVFWKTVTVPDTDLLACPNDASKKCLQDWEEFLQAKFRLFLCVIACWIIEMW